MTYYIVYKITNNLNRKLYIGTHVTNDLNDKYMGSGLGIKRAIRKYGIDNFRKEIIFVFNNKEEMFMMEKLLVDTIFINQPDIYNSKPGGKGGSEKGRKLSEKTKQKMSATRLVINWQRGKPGYFRGKFGTNHHRSKAVVMVDKDTRSMIKIFGSAREAERLTGIRNTNISTACRGKINGNRLAGGYRWRYFNPWKGY